MIQNGMLTYELHYRAEDKSSSQATLVDVGGRLPATLRQAWNEQLRRDSESLGFGQKSVRFEVVQEGWPAEWTVVAENRTGRIPRLVLSALVNLPGMTASLEVPARSSLEPVASVAPADQVWVDAWLAQLESSLLPGATDGVGREALQFAWNELRSEVQHDPYKTALHVLQAVLIYRTWRADEAGEDERRLRLSIALCETVHAADPSHRRPASVSSQSMIAAVRAIVDRCFRPRGDLSANDGPQG